ncbi:GntR family transcriptional regulator [Paraburkholderia adhaesiva]|uniref:GntR family transcriptional regulator n=1 Tax=Paraburkholderia adhaesiva TaxID=2883244 RepID=UPI0027E4AE69|nr:GntR family transcriptional regulator [Paraburkholderia adhaesiva]
MLVLKRTHRLCLSKPIPKRALHKSIVPGVCFPGGVLPNEIELARSRGVSRTVAREVLQKLAAPGLVEVKRR